MFCVHTAAFKVGESLTCTRVSKDTLRGTSRNKQYYEGAEQKRFKATKASGQSWLELQCMGFILAVTNQDESGLKDLIWTAESNGFHQLSPDQVRKKKERGGIFKGKMI